MNQHDYVRGCLTFYEEEGLTPEKGWDEAHYPDPDGQGGETIWLRHGDHQAQGLWQSKEYDRLCFFPGDALRFLTSGPFVPGWFELWDIYDEYKGENGRKSVKEKTGIHAPEMKGVGGKKSANLGVGVHAPGIRSKGGKNQPLEAKAKGGKNQPLEAKVRGGKALSKQKYQNTDPNFPPYVSTCYGLSSWQRARGIDTAMRVKL